MHVLRILVSSENQYGGQTINFVPVIIAKYFFYLFIYLENYGSVHVMFILFIFMPPYCNGGGILFSSSPTNFQLWWACHISSERSLRVHSEIDSFCLSVCTTIFKRITSLRFLPKIFDNLYHWIRLNEFYKLL